MRQKRVIKSVKRAYKLGSRAPNREMESSNPDKSWVMGWMLDVRMSINVCFLDFNLCYGF